MNCQEFDRQMKSFLEQKMEDSVLEDFLCHYQKCAYCHEELEINFLTAWVLNDDVGISFNLQEEMDRYIQEELGRMNLRYRYRLAKNTLVAASEIIAFLTVLYFLLFLL